MAARLQIGALIFAILAAIAAGVLLFGGTAFGRYGDADCDATVSTVDAAMVLYHEAHLQELPCSENADLNGDQRVNSKDAAMILQIVAGLWSTNVVSNSDCPPQGCPTSTPCPPGGCPTNTPMPTNTPCPSDGCPSATPTRTPCSPEGCPTEPAATPRPTSTPPATGAEFSIAIDTSGDGVADCTTAAAGPNSCTASEGDVLTAMVSLDELPIELAQDGYAGWDVTLSFSGMTLVNHGDPHAWPDCVFAAYAAFSLGKLSVGCAVGVDDVGALPPSTYRGVILTVPFDCSASGDIALVHRAENTDIVDSMLRVYVEAVSGQEALHIICATP